MWRVKQITSTIQYVIMRRSLDNFTCKICKNDIKPRNKGHCVGLQLPFTTNRHQFVGLVPERCHSSVLCTRVCTWNDELNCDKLMLPQFQLTRGIEYLTLITAFIRDNQDPLYCRPYRNCCQQRIYRPVSLKYRSSWHGHYDMRPLIMTINMIEGDYNV